MGLKRFIALIGRFWLSVLFTVVRSCMRLVPKGLLRNHVAEWVTNQIIGVVIALFVVGSIFVTAIVWVSNATKYAGANAAVITICTVLIPTMGGLACFSKVLVLFGFV